MKKYFYAIFGLLALSSVSLAQTYDTKTLVDTNSTSTSTSTVNSNSTSTATNNTNVTSTSTNTNINSGTQTFNNNNVNSGTQTFNNNTNYSGSQTVNNNMNYSGSQIIENKQSGGTNNTNTNTNTNNSTNYNYGDQTVRNVQSGGTTNTNTNNNSYSGDQTIRNVQSGGTTNTNNVNQRVEQPPPTAIAPAMMSGGNNDLCTTGTSGAVQTQILGVSTGGTVRDMNCERLKLASRLYDMGMKVAAVSALCQDRRVFDAMWNAGTPCPYEGKIGEAAREQWEQNPHKIPKEEVAKTDDTYKKMGLGALLGAVIYKIFHF